MPQPDEYEYRHNAGKTERRKAGTSDPWEDPNAAPTTGKTDKQISAELQTKPSDASIAEDSKYEKMTDAEIDALPALSRGAARARRDRARARTAAKTPADQAKAIKQ